MAVVVKVLVVFVVVDTDVLAVDRVVVVVEEVLEESDVSSVVVTTPENRKYSLLNLCTKFFKASRVNGVG